MLEIKLKDRDKTVGRIRRFNAILAVALMLFFFAHATMGSLTQIIPIQNDVEWLIWTFAALILVHVITCVATSFFMLTNTKNPPSKGKKQHLVLKWATGVLLLLFVFLHVTGAFNLYIPIMIMLLGILAWHSYVGVKSFTRDLNMPGSLRMPIRIALIVLAVIIAGIALYGVFF